MIDPMAKKKGSEKASEGKSKESVSGAQKKTASGGTAEKGKDPLSQKVEALEAQIFLLEKQVEEAKKAQMRALADLENFRRRELSQKSQWSEMAVSQFIKKLLPSFLELSLGAEHSKDESVKQVIAKFFKALEKEGVRKIEPTAGEPVDTEKHEVLLAEQSDKKGIVRCLEPGWQYHEIVIIPAKVSATRD